MNIVGSTIVTPIIDAPVSIHGNHEGNGTAAGIRDASQKGLIPAIYPPIKDFARRAASIGHFPRVISSLRSMACQTLQSSKITAGTAKEKREAMRIAGPTSPYETALIRKPVVCTLH